MLNQTVSSRVIIATSTPNALIRDLANEYNLSMNVNKEKTGIAGDWNYALACCKTPLATIAHQDDIYCRDYTESMLSRVNKAANPLIYFSDYGELLKEQFVEFSTMLRVKRIMLAPLKRPSNASSAPARRLSLALGNPICCPSVTYVLDALDQPLFNSGMRSNLDWDTWERLSRKKGEFIYDSSIRMYHRIHDASETSACIADNIRFQEDLDMLKRFWPKPIAYFINHIYATAQRYN